MASFLLELEGKAFTLNSSRSSLDSIQQGLQCERLYGYQLQ